MTEGRRHALFAWLADHGLHLPILDPSPPSEELFVNPHAHALFGPVHVEYARACGESAWLVLIRGVPRPYIVVPEESPATEFIIRYHSICEVPVCAAPIVSNPMMMMTTTTTTPTRTGSVVMEGPRSVESVAMLQASDADSRVQSHIRENILASRRIEFLVDVDRERGYLDHHDDDDDDDHDHDHDGGRGDGYWDNEDGDDFRASAPSAPSSPGALLPVTLPSSTMMGESLDRVEYGGSDHYHHHDAEAYYYNATGDETPQAFGEEPITYDRDYLSYIVNVELDTLADTIGYDYAEKIIPLIRADLMAMYAKEFEALEPEYHQGMMMARAPPLHATVDDTPTPLDASDEILSTGNDDGGVMYTRESRECYEDDMRTYTPYESPLTVLWGNGSSSPPPSGEYDESEDNGESRVYSVNERKRMEEQKRLRENIRWFYQRTLSLVGLADPPKPAPASTSRIPVAGESLLGSGDEEQFSNSADPDPEGADDLEEYGHHEAFTSSPMGTTVEDDGERKTTRFLSPNCIQRSVTKTEKRLMDGYWCVMTLHEFQAWRCVAQSMLSEGSILHALRSPNPLPPWLLNPLQDRAESGVQRAQALEKSVRDTTPALCAMADAMERFLALASAIAKDAPAAASSQRRSGVVEIDAAFWEQLRCTAENALATYEKCFCNDHHHHHQQRNGANSSREMGETTERDGTKGQ
jgi:hypothetical protein